MVSERRPRSKTSQISRDARFVVLDRHIQRCLPVLVYHGQARTAFHEELHEFERRVSLAGFMQRRIITNINDIHIGPVIQQKANFCGVGH